MFAHANLHAFAVFALGSLAELKIGLISSLTDRETTARLLAKLDAVGEFRLHDEPEALSRFRDWVVRAKTANEKRNRALHTPWLKAVEGGTLQRTEVTPSGTLKVKTLPAGELEKIASELVSVAAECTPLLLSIREDYKHLFEKSPGARSGAAGLTKSVTQRRPLRARSATSSTMANRIYPPSAADTRRLGERIIGRLFSSLLASASRRVMGAPGR